VRSWAISAVPVGAIRVVARGLKGSIILQLKAKGVRLPMSLVSIRVCVGFIDGSDNASRIKERTRPGEDADVNFVISIMDCVRPSHVVTIGEPRFMHAVSPKVVLRSIKAPVKGKPNVSVKAKRAQPIVESLLFIGVVGGKEKIWRGNRGLSRVRSPGEEDARWIHCLKLSEHGNKQMAKSFANSFMTISFRSGDRGKMHFIFHTKMMGTFGNRYRRGRSVAICR
jgi:hypothetical protein